MPWYKKLIRDRIPDIVAAQGSRAETIVLDDNDYFFELLGKLLEEVRECREAQDAMTLVEELADLQEVIDALLVYQGISKESFHTLQAAKREKRGGFTKRLYLLRVHEE